MKSTFLRGERAATNLKTTSHLIAAVAPDRARRLEHAQCRVREEERQLSLGVLTGEHGRT